MKKLPLSYVLLKNMTCLSPLAHMQPETVQMISAVIDQLPLCHSVRNIKDNVVQEWKLYQQEEIGEEFLLMLLEPKMMVCHLRRTNE